VQQPDPDDHPNLQQGIRRGRLSAFIRGDHTQDDDQGGDE
jgi:hypothetical protein